MSKTAERACARSTTSRSFSSGASPLTLKRHADAREAVADLVGEAERAADVHVALERRLDLGQAHLARRRDVDERRRQARGQRVQQVLGRVRAGVGAEQDGRLAGVDRERLGARGVLLAGAVEALDRRAVVGAVDPAVAGAELEARRASGSALIGVERAVHLLRCRRRCGCGRGPGTREVSFGSGGGPDRARCPRPGNGGEAGVRARRYARCSAARESARRPWVQRT